MDLWQSSILGLLQGLTEFLPVSSSGHLVLGQRLLGLHQPELLFDIAVHVGTLAAVLAVFRNDLAAMVKGIFQSGEQARKGRRLIMLVVVGSIPTALIGLLFKDYFEALFGSTLAVGIALLVTGVILALTRLAPDKGRPLEKVGPISALAVGLAQSLAITPGISRSGTTISLALLIGVERSLAARYSFLLSIPAILGALLLQLMDVRGLPAPDMTPLLVGGVIAALSGYLALKLLLKVVDSGRMHFFAPYCWALGLAAVLLSL